MRTSGRRDRASRALIDRAHSMFPGRDRQCYAGGCGHDREFLFACHPFPPGPRSYCGAEMSREDEARLADRLIAGDPSAFRELVEAYKRKVYGLAYEITRNHAHAEDAPQVAVM